ncbi:MAG: type II toxin-antitoxin system RatA family toxin [Acidiphilium sp.]|nr:type II toxin-antitoxin system RatA family toxin [Acidiphilium sp.]MDD4936995.1 type II toxin-antitoxin system RatA family toxin [Acidiphilium sp.]
MPKYSECKVVPYRPEQMFDLVADVGKYPQFLPWCVGARIRSHRCDILVADLTIGFGPFRESFTSRVVLGAPEHIDVHYQNGPFKYLRNEWRFVPDPRGTMIDFYVDFEFRSFILQKTIGAVFAEAVRRMVAAFLTRARDIYGVPQPIPVSAPAKV